MSGDNQVKNMKFRIHHTNLPVSDIDRSIKFYSDFLGMTVRSRHKNEAQKRELVLLGYGDETAAPFLELRGDTSGNQPAKIPPTNTHIAIDVDDLRALYAILQKAGVPITRELRPRTAGEGYSAWVADPDGHEIELSERYSVI